VEPEVRLDDEGQPMPWANSGTPNVGAGAIGRTPILASQTTNARMNEFIRSRGAPRAEGPTNAALLDR
jgi:hypothetical protein